MSSHRGSRRRKHLSKRECSGETTGIGAHEENDDDDDGEEFSTRPTGPDRPNGRRKRRRTAEAPRSSRDDFGCCFDYYWSALCSLVCWLVILLDN